MSDCTHTSLEEARTYPNCFGKPGNVETTYHLSTCMLKRHSGPCSLDGPVHPMDLRDVDCELAGLRF